MSNHRVSYWKTALPAGVAGSCLLMMTRVVAPGHGVQRGLVVAAGCLIALPPVSIALSALVVLCRDAIVTKRARDPFHALNRSRSEAVLAAGGNDLGLRFRKLVRALLWRRMLLVGDYVEIRPFEEIRRTLDDSDCLDGLPFIPEMVAFCGQRSRVFRRVDKIYDYGGKKVVRRLRGTVLLPRVHCDGSAHGGCQAGCYVMWKEAWLKRADPPGAAVQLPVADASGQLKPQSKVDHDGMTTYSCQFTQLVAASTPLKYWDPRQDLRPLAAGNITLGAFALALFTRLFNYVQGRRGGLVFPPMSHSQQARTPVTATIELKVGDSVRVQPAQAIFRTLDINYRNRGLWFDRDMVKHCGREYQVLKRVDRIIDDATGRIRDMKTPCIVLKDVSYSGEFLRFCAQEEHLYWREAWLSPTQANTATTDQPGRQLRAN